MKATAYLLFLTAATLTAAAPVDEGLLSPGTTSPALSRRLRARAPAGEWNVLPGTTSSLRARAPAGEWNVLPGTTSSLRARAPAGESNNEAPWGPENPPLASRSPVDESNDEASRSPENPPTEPLLAGRAPAGEWNVAENTSPVARSSRLVARSFAS
ncbi:Drf-FH1 domain containing protein [Pyrenophora tritici-repentis]|nr:Drf-FH1 domain containing protein [Pyrenophora tritici-repentis]